MKKCSLTDASRYSSLSPAFAHAIDWLTHRSLADIAPGRHEIGCGVTVNCEEPELRPVSEAKLEAHRRYADIHVPVSGLERIGLAPVSALSCPLCDYDSGRDIIFFADDYSEIVDVTPGEMLIVLPEDAHAPNIGEGAHRKLCIKIPV